MKPSFQTKFEKPSIKNSSNKLILEIQEDMCPTGTVPIRRITKDDLIRDKSMMYNHTLAQNNLVSRVSFLIFIIHQILNVFFVYLHKSHFLNQLI